MNFEEELLADAQEDAQAVEYIARHLPQELKETFSEEHLYYFLDLIVEYLSESGVLEKEADADGYVDIDEETMAKYLSKKAQKEGVGNFSPDDLLFVVQYYMDYEEETYSEDE